MATFKVFVRTDKVGSKVEDVLELDDDTVRNEDGSLNTEAIDEAAREFLNNLMEWGWHEVES